MTIYALSSGPGLSGIAVIRISGKITKQVINLLTSVDLPKPRVATIRKFNKINNSELIDEGILLWFPGPQSYTGEDMAEIHVHGSIAVVRAILDQISKIEDCRLAEPGEFTRIAFQNEKINIFSEKIQKIEGKFETIIYLNVLEHIENDLKEIDDALSKINKGGYLIIVVPAHQKLYTNFDKEIGHFRRYDKR